MIGLKARLEPMPLIAILRGLQPERALEVGRVLVEAGFRAIEVPLNSPEPLLSIRRLADDLGEHALIGAGTVLDVADVARIADAGGRLIVMPHADLDVVQEARRIGLACTPGVATPSEAFAALGAGADALKMFPAEALPPAVVRAWRSVLPEDCWLMPVGGIMPATMAAYVAAGAAGFGLGSALFRPDMEAAMIAANARIFVSALGAARIGRE